MTFQRFDAEYVRRLAQGDAGVEEHFASYFGNLLFLKLRARLRSRQLIEDVRQETFVRVLQVLRSERGVEYPERFGPFVNAVCNNVLKEFCRKEAKHDAMDDSDEGPADTHIDLDAPLISRENKRRVERVLKELPEKDRDLLIEFYLKETGKSELCVRLNVDADYLRVLVHRARARFRDLDRAGPSSPL